MQRSRRFSALGGVIILLCLTVMYVHDRPVWPPGHPWSAVTFAALATSQFLQAAGVRFEGRGRLAYIAAGGVGIAAAVGWFVAI